MSKLKIAIIVIAICGIAGFAVGVFRALVIL
jgi:hypothetical protein